MNVQFIFVLQCLKKEIATAKELDLRLLGKVIIFRDRQTDRQLLLYINPNWYHHHHRHHHRKSTLVSPSSSSPHHGDEQVEKKDHQQSDEQEPVDLS